MNLIHTYVDAFLTVETAFEVNVEVLQDLPATLYATGQLQHVLSVRTTKTIKAGDQLWMSYGRPFWAKIDFTDTGILTSFKTTSMMLLARRSVGVKVAWGTATRGSRTSAAASASGT